MRIPSGCSNLERLEIVDRVKGMIFGTILGDSLGLATEGMTQEQVRSVYSSGPILFGLDDDQETRGVGFLKDSYRSMFDDNDFGDDAEQQLLILQSIQENRGTFNYKDFAARFKLYSNQGIHGLNKQPLGIKTTNQAVVYRHDFLEDPHHAAIEIWKSDSHSHYDNGALVRSALLGVPKFWDGTTVIQSASECCRITHPDPRSVMSCVIVSTLVARILRGQDREMEALHTSQPSPLPSPPLPETFTCMHDSIPSPKATEDMESDKAIMSLVKAVIDTNKRILTVPNSDPLFPTPEIDIDTMHAYYEQLMDHCYREPIELSTKLPESHVFTCLTSGLYAFTRAIPKGNETGHFRKLLMEVVMQGGAADANGSMAGALVGLRIGYKALPTEWVVGLKRWEWLEDLIDEFCEML